MMDPAVKTAIALCVLLAGVCAAMLFRNDRSTPVPAQPNAEKQLLLRYRARTSGRETPSGEIGRSARAAREAQRALTRQRSVTVVTPSDRHEPPPSLAPDYPDSDRLASSRWGVSMDMMLPIAAPTDQTASTHTVVDGDTLAALAERYLGSATRAAEIYEANRDVLHDPNLLPIGAELKIPPQGDHATSSAR